MSKRPNQFKRFKPPKKVSADEESTEKKKKKKKKRRYSQLAYQSTTCRPASPTKSPSSSESEQDTPGSSHLAKPATDNLVVTNSNFDLINSHLNNIYPYVRRRAQVILNHDAIPEALNSCSQPPNTITISDQLPRPPYRVSFSDDFVKAHKEKVSQYSRRLSRGIATEYQRIAEQLQADIDRLVEAAEATLFMIIDEEEQGRCIQLFMFDYKLSTGVSITGTVVVSSRVKEDSTESSFI